MYCFLLRTEQDSLADGTATIPDPAVPAKLKVKFSRCKRYYMSLIIFIVIVQNKIPFSNTCSILKHQNKAIL